MKGQFCHYEHVFCQENYCSDCEIERRNKTVTCPKLDNKCESEWLLNKLMKGDSTLRDGELTDERTLENEINRIGRSGLYFKTKPVSVAGHLGCRKYGTKPNETFVLTTRLGEKIDLNRDDAVYMKMSLTVALKGD